MITLHQRADSTALTADRALDEHRCPRRPVAAIVMASLAGLVSLSACSTQESGAAEVRPEPVSVITTASVRSAPHESGPASRPRSLPAEAAVVPEPPAPAWVSSPAPAISPAPPEKSVPVKKSFITNCELVNDPW